jgi:hypothetical protein
LRESRLPAQAIRRVVRHSAGGFRECWSAALGRDAQLSGRVVVRFAIGADGSVLRAEELAPTIPDRELRRCLLERFFALSFDNSPGRLIEVEYPLVLRRDGPEPLAELDDASRAAAPPPADFAVAFRAGTPVSPPRTRAPAPAPAPTPRPERCQAGDPLCAE